jgi:hypothetical protein
MWEGSDPATEISGQPTVPKRLIKYGLGRDQDDLPFTLFGHEFITQKKLLVSPSVPLAAYRLFPSRVRPVAKNTAPGPRAKKLATSSVKSVGSKTRRAGTTTPVPPLSTACRNGGKTIRNTGNGTFRMRIPLRINPLIYAPCWQCSSRKIPALRYKIPGPRKSLPLLESLGGSGAMRYKISSPPI